ncbi:hypothetical protein [Tepidibacter hydrothermalis]|uniref:Uncharacterized protein n=1 Tax=Tepidibacter hydrothermalis TaxID=3036126 RepID=A0ABY8EA70_9FIRM|nr:hypothetical protein [Tepidibacter hydrothermalis]WFD09817.1 hypothetical protein P4S50_15670 [Tepidibacter hydrothermalis]
MYEINCTDGIVSDMMRSMSLLAGASIIVSICNALFWIFTVIYVYKDSKNKGLDTLLWTLTTAFVPYHLGFLTYLIVNHNKSFDNEEKYNLQSKDMFKSIKVDKKVITKLLIILTLIIVLLFGGALLTVKLIYKGFNNYERDAIGMTASSSKTYSNKITNYERSDNAEVIKTENTFKSSYSDFNSSEEAEIRYPKDGNLKINYKSKVKKGSLKIGLYKYNGEPVKTFYTNEEWSISVPIKKNTIYRLIATGENTKGYYEVDWEFEPEED